METESVFEKPTLTITVFDNKKKTIYIYNDVGVKSFSIVP